VATAAAAEPALQVIARGFGQDQRVVGYGFLVKNTSPTLVTDQTGYVVTGYDATGRVVNTANGQVGIVLPGQRQGVAGTFAVPGDARVARIDVQLAPAAYHLAWEGSPPGLSTTILGPRAKAPSTTVSGTVVNPDSVGFDGASVSAIAYDAAGQIIGGGSTRVGALAPDARLPVDVPLTASAPPIQLELYAAPSALPAIH
jgi:hypothetical protein